MFYAHKVMPGGANAESARRRGAGPGRASSLNKNKRSSLLDVVFKSRCTDSQSIRFTSWLDSSESFLSRLEHLLEATRLLLKEMSLTTSAATAVWTVLVDDPGDGRERRWEDQTKEQRDLYTQFVISCALGLGAFLSFCVCLWSLDLGCCLIANPVVMDRSCDQNGRSFTPHEGDKDAQPRGFRSCQTASLGGFRCCIESLMRRYCSRPVWMHMWWVFQPLGVSLSSKRGYH